GYAIDDPAPGIAKILQIQFKDKDGHPQVINLNENEIFIITPNEIVKATSLPTSFINGAVYRADKAPVKVTDILNANIGKKIQVTNDFFKKYTPSFDAGSNGLLSIWFKDAKGNTPTYYFDEGEELLLTQAKVSKPHQKFIIKAEYRETDKETQCVKKSTDVTQIIKNNFRNRIALTAGNFSDKLIKAAPGGTFLIYFINKDGTKQIAQFQDGSVVILTRGSLAWSAKNTDQDAVSTMPKCPVQ
ncbi:MAG: hypothetical protein P4L31_08335, partial [Candidatus Babeliales bacterium]|nr:hypothetical protein [Candidatus Babeliales bacterium]